MPIACSSAATVCASKRRRKASPLDRVQSLMERSHPSSGRSATPADIIRNGRPTSFGTGGRHQSECPADIIGIRKPDRAVVENPALAGIEGPPLRGLARDRAGRPPRHRVLERAQAPLPVGPQTATPHRAPPRDRCRAEYGNNLAEAPLSPDLGTL